METGIKTAKKIEDIPKIFFQQIILYCRSIMYSSLGYKNILIIKNHTKQWRSYLGAMRDSFWYYPKRIAIIGLTEIPSFYLVNLSKVECPEYHGISKLRIRRKIHETGQN